MADQKLQMRNKGSTILNLNLTFEKPPENFAEGDIYRLMELFMQTTIENIQFIKDVKPSPTPSTKTSTINLKLCGHTIIDDELQAKILDHVRGAIRAVFGDCISNEMGLDVIQEVDRVLNALGSTITNEEVSKSLEILPPASKRKLVEELSKLADKDAAKITFEFDSETKKGKSTTESQTASTHWLFPYDFRRLNDLPEPVQMDMMTGHKKILSTPVPASLFHSIPFHSKETVQAQYNLAKNLSPVINAYEIDSLQNGGLGFYPILKKFSDNRGTIGTLLKAMGSMKTENVSKEDAAMMNEYKEKVEKIRDDAFEEILTNVIYPSPTDRGKWSIQAIIQSLKKVTMGEMKRSTSAEVMNAANNLKKLCARPEFRSDFMSQVKADCPDIATDIPDFEKALDSLETIPLDRFSNPAEVLTFVDALINSGKAAQVERGLIFVLGNTNTGKTSLVNTFKSFVESPSKKPTSGLTKPGDDLIETQVLEVYDNLSLEQDQTIKVGLSSNSSAPTLVNLEDSEVAATNSSEKEMLKLKIVDLGGHQEYFTSSSLFIASTGLFLVCFDSSEPELLWKEYYSRVGTYLDLINQTADIAGIKPKIMLVATKVENMDQQCQESLDKILSDAKQHLTDLSSNSFLVDGVLKTSSKTASQEVFEDMYGKLYTLCTAEELRSKPKEAIPTFWFRLLAALKKMSQTTVEEMIEMLEQIEAEKTGPSNIPKEELESLEKLRKVVLFLAEVNVSSTATLDKSEMSSETSNPDREPPEDKSKTGELSASGDTKEPIGPKSTSLSDATSYQGRPPLIRAEPGAPASTEKRAKIMTVIGYLKGLGELLFYPNNPDLCEVVITRPMDLVRSLRTVINHKPANAFKSAEFQQQKQKLLCKGLLSYNDFRTVYNSGPEQAFSEEQVWNFLLQLELGCSIGESEAEKQIMVPSLIDESMENKFKKTGMELEGHEACWSIQYNFDKTGKTFGMFMKFFKIFSKVMLFGDRGGEILLSYSQKVETKKLGCVTGVYGVMKWHTDISNIQKPEEFDFLLTEYEINLPSPIPEENSKCYAIHRGIRISLRPKTQASVCADATIKILSKLDSKFTSNLENVQMCLPCKKCILDGKYGYFPLEEGIRLQSAHSRCSQNFEHTMDEASIEIMQRAAEPKPFQLEPLMDTKREDLGLEIFEDSDLMRKMLSGEMEKGEQIWVYHDAEINPNSIAKRMAYSHVMIYVGPRQDEDGQEIHEVVHAEWAGRVFLGSTVVDKITRVDVMSAIEPDDMVFLGHKLKQCQFSANAREMIAKRAIACTEPPEILFDYDYRTNCETFCNMIVFGKPESTQTKGTAKSIKRLFKGVNFLRPKSRKCLGEQIQQRLEEKRLL